MGMIVRSSDAMQGIGFAIVFPLSFLAGTFVPIAGMDAGAPGHRRVGPALGAGRRRPPGQPGHRTSHGSWQLEHPVLAMIGWCVLIIAVCVPLALRRFRTHDRRLTGPLRAASLTLLAAEVLPAAKIVGLAGALNALRADREVRARFDGGLP